MLLCRGPSTKRGQVQHLSLSLLEFPYGGLVGVGVCVRDVEHDADVVLLHVQRATDAQLARSLSLHTAPLLRQGKAEGLIANLKEAGHSMHSGLRAPPRHTLLFGNTLELLSLEKSTAKPACLSLVTGTPRSRGLTPRFPRLAPPAATAKQACARAARGRVVFRFLVSHSRWAQGASHIAARLRCARRFVRLLWSLRGWQTFFVGHDRRC